MLICSLIIIIMIVIIIIREICKAPTPRFKALNKHNNIINVHRDGECYRNLTKANI